MQEKTTFTRRTRTEERQDTQAQSRTVKLFSKMAVESEALAAVSLLFVVLQYRLLKGRKRYLFNATENVRLYCKLFEIHFCIKSDCICRLYFLLLNKRFFGPLVLLPHIFRQEFPLIYLNNVHHKAPDISLYYLPISRLKWKKPSCFQCAVVAWNLFLYYPCVCVASVDTCEMQTQTYENETFSISCVEVGICVCICVDVVHTCIFLLLRLHLRRTCEPDLRHNPSFTSLYCRTLQRTLVVSRTKF